MGKKSRFKRDREDMLDNLGRMTREELKKLEKFVKVKTGKKLRKDHGYQAALHQAGANPPGDVV